MDGVILTYVDLDIDVLALPDLSYEILDLDEFDRNVALYGYSEEIKLRSQGAIDELTSMIEARQFPFDS
jgi:protein associated with RNAse G/E